MDESIAQERAELNARRQNAADLWDRLWEKEGDETWRAQALARVYARVVRLINLSKSDGSSKSVCDIGGGRGILAEKVRDECSSVVIDAADIMVVDNSPVALRACQEKDLITFRCDLENSDELETIPGSTIYVSTECFEHLSQQARWHLCALMSVKGSGAIISVPNNRLGPEEEPQHTVKFNAVSLKDELEHYWPKRVRVEVLGPYLLAVCGSLAEKGFTLSACLPVRDEAADLEGTLASIRGIADQLVVGVDPRTTDSTFEIAKLYADEVFYLERPMGPPHGHTKFYCKACDASDCKEYMGQNGIHFSWARNQCLDRCTGDWIFMTEGHERLVAGEDILLSLDRIMPEGARIGFVLRQGQGQQWAFPWLFKNARDIRFKRPVHNVLDFPEKTFSVTLPQIKTLHDRDHSRGESRAKQRKAQNRSALLDDWLSRGSEASLFYLGQEWRDIDKDRAIERLEQFLTVSKVGVQRYQARLILAKEYARKGNLKDAFRVLHGCTADDWSRTEHFVWLGDLARIEEDYEKALRFYQLASTSIGNPPVTVWWIELSYYSYIPAQRLAQTLCDLGDLEKALVWSRAVYELLPNDAPPEAFEEAKANVTLIEDTLSKWRTSEDESNEQCTTGNQGDP